MIVVYSPVALRELDEIFDYNERIYDADHAASYVGFLRGHIDALESDPDAGTPVGGFLGRLALTIRRSPRGHGHIAVYRIEGEVIRVLHIFHTAQDVRGRLEQE